MDKLTLQECLITTSRISSSVAAAAIDIGSNNNNNYYYSNNNNNNKTDLNNNNVTSWGFRELLSSCPQRALQQAAKGVLFSLLRSFAIERFRPVKNCCCSFADALLLVCIYTCATCCALWSCAVQVKKNISLVKMCLVKLQRLRSWGAELPSLTLFTVRLMCWCTRVVCRALTPHLRFHTANVRIGCQGLFWMMSPVSSW